MSYLVHPTGWRLYHKKFWKTTLFSNKKYLPLLNLKNKVVYEYIRSVLKNINYRMRHRSLLSLDNFNLVMSQKNIYVFIHYKLYWKIYKSAISVFLYKYGGLAKLMLDPHQTLIETPWNKKSFKKTIKPSGFYSMKHKIFSNSKIYKKKLTRFDFIERKLFYFQNQINPKLDPDRKSIIPNYLRYFNTPEIAPLYKMLLLYFTFFPIFNTLKLYIYKLLKVQFKSSFKAEIYFFGNVWYYFSPTDLLNLVEFFILKKNYSPIKTLYIVIRIMLKYQKRFKLRGFKFLLAGRFSRRDRATYLWKTFGGINLSSKYSSVEYYARPLQGRYSKAIAKLWVCRS